MCDSPAFDEGRYSGCMPHCPPYPSYYPRPTPCTIILCSQPVPEILRPKITCKAYFPSVEPIKSVRFTSPSTPSSDCSGLTNLAYHPMIQGGISYCGVDRLVPLASLPGAPTMFRPAPIRPSDHPDMIVYSAP